MVWFGFGLAFDLLSFSQSSQSQVFRKFRADLP